MKTALLCDWKTLDSFTKRFNSVGEDLDGDTVKKDGSDMHSDREKSESELSAIIPDAENVPRDDQGLK